MKPQKQQIIDILIVIATTYFCYNRFILPIRIQNNQEDVTEDLPPPKIVRAPRASKISTDECINTHRSSTYDEAFFASKWGKCENSARKWPDYVKITPQNSTNYVKSTVYTRKKVGRSFCTNLATNAFYCQICTISENAFWFSFQESLLN